jgi:hypothetical protein
VIDSTSGKVLATRPLIEVCGLAPDHAGFRATTGTGDIIGADGSKASFDGYALDNHLRRIG